ncbi:hypothetical protein RFI_14477, partial [Reticulomyxa filosa]
MVNCCSVAQANVNKGQKFQKLSLQPHGNIYILKFAKNRPTIKPTSTVIIVSLFFPFFFPCYLGASSCPNTLAPTCSPETTSSFHEERRHDKKGNSLKSQAKQKELGNKGEPNQKKEKVKTKTNKVLYEKKLYFFFFLNEKIELFYKFKLTVLFEMDILGRLWMVVGGGGEKIEQAQQRKKMFEDDWKRRLEERQKRQSNKLGNKKQKKGETDTKKIQSFLKKVKGLCEPRNAKYVQTMTKEQGTKDCVILFISTLCQMYTKFEKKLEVEIAKIFNCKLLSLSD